MQYCELCATSRFGGINLVSFVVNFLTTRHNKTCPAKAGEIHKGHNPAKVGEKKSKN
ncbi:MAG: hypothetical protein LBS01_06100 [Prevotellaceae bacterium]|jgi:hypothetical protein|nr:hypothetical protein [Prevotellaceae bacterium]